jgi:lysyl-tRNA synthetase class 2
MVMLRQRAALLAELRAFFAERGVMEVETPLLSAFGATAHHLDSFVTRYQGPGAPAGQTLYLQTSPEYAMKRLLAAGSGPVYQITKAFRNGEAGRRHNPEFTLLEWYRPGFDYHALMAEVDALLQRVLGAGPAQRLSYSDAFLQHLQIDPHTADAGDLRRCAAMRLPHVPDDLGADRDGWLSLLWTHLIEPQLGRGPVIVHDYPAVQAMLARIRPGSPPVAERFEVYVDGMELANGFQELQDGAEQRRRFEDDSRRRARLGLPVMAADERLLEALQYLPFCSGVALGIDRLLLVKTGARELAQVLSFSLERA